jgi:hypothetical protein
MTERSTAIVMLLTRAEPGDSDRAGELLSQALAAARTLGLPPIERPRLCFFPAAQHEPKAFCGRIVPLNRHDPSRE